MASHKFNILLITALAAGISVASAEPDSSFPIVNLARITHPEQRPDRRGIGFDPDTYEGGVYKVGYDACQTQLKAATAPVQITMSDGGTTLTAENVPSACMTITGALTNNFAEGYPVPMGTDKLEITNATEDTVSRVNSVLGGSVPPKGGSVVGGSAMNGANVTGTALNSTSSASRLPSRSTMRRIARERNDQRL